MMNWIDRLHELRKLKREYLMFICLDEEIKDVPDEFSREISNVAIEISEIENMPTIEAQQKIKFKTIEIKSRL